MKRMNLMVDEELLEKARQYTGEKTYSGTINGMLERLVRSREFVAAVERIRQKGGSFSDESIEANWPDVAARLKRHAVSGDVKRAPTKKVRGRAAR